MTDKTCINCQNYLTLDLRCKHESWPCEGNRVCNIGRFEACEAGAGVGEKEEFAPYLSDCLESFDHGSACVFVDAGVKKIDIPSPKHYTGKKIRIERTEAGIKALEVIVNDMSEVLFNSAGSVYAGMLVIPIVIGVVELLSISTNWVVVTWTLGTESE